MRDGKGFVIYKLWGVLIHLPLKQGIEQREWDLHIYQGRRDTYVNSYGENRVVICGAMIHDLPFIIEMDGQDGSKRILFPFD